MGRIAKLFGLVLFSALSSSFSYGDDLVSILELALENDPTLRQAQANYRVNHENLIQSRSSLLPVLGARAGTTRETSGPTSTLYISDPLTGAPVINPITGEQARAEDHSFRPGINTHNWGLSLTQSVFNLSNWYTFESAKANDKAAAVQLATMEQDLIMRVAAAYFDVLRAIDALDTNNQEEEASLRSLEQTRQREEVGLVAITDVYDAQASYDLSRNTTILQENFLISRYEALEAITGIPHPQIEELREDFPIVGVDGSLDEWEDQADSNSLAIAQAEYNLDASQDTLKARKSSHLPYIDLQGVYSHARAASITRDGVRSGGGAFNSTRLALQLTIPLYSGGATASRRRAAEYSVVAARESLQLTKRQLTQNVRDAYRRVNTDVLVIAQRQQSITSAQSRLDATELGAEVGTRNIVEVLLARENLYQALRVYADARYNYVIDSLLLKQVTGTLTPDDIIALNEWLQ